MQEHRAGWVPELARELGLVHLGRCEPQPQFFLLPERLFLPLAKPWVLLLEHLALGVDRTLVFLFRGGSGGFMDGGGGDGGRRRRHRTMRVSLGGRGRLFSDEIETLLWSGGCGGIWVCDGGVCGRGGPPRRPPCRRQPLPPPGRARVRSRRLLRPGRCPPSHRHLFLLWLLKGLRTVDAVDRDGCKRAPGVTRPRRGQPRRNLHLWTRGGNTAGELAAPNGLFRGGSVATGAGGLLLDRRSFHLVGRRGS